MDSVMEARRRLLMMADELPRIYRRVEYLETDGESWLNLNETASIDCEIGLECYTTYNPNSNAFYMGCRRAFCAAIIGVQPSKVPNLVYQFGNMISSVFTTPITLNDRHEIVANNTGCYVDGAKIYNYTYDMDVRDSTNHIMLFATSKENDVIEFKAPAGFKVYSAYVKKGGVYIASLIPCIRKSDSEPGMYDTVRKTFFTNIGTGEFIVPS